MSRWDRRWDGTRDVLHQSQSQSQSQSPLQEVTGSGLANHRPAQLQTARETTEESADGHGSDRRADHHHPRGDTVSEPGCYICQPDNQNAAEEGCAACEKDVLEAVMRAYSSRSSSLAPTTIPVRGAEQHTTQEDHHAQG